ncbi:MAG: TetR family transcriptional regulator [Bacteroidetes bacterium]|nr:MAG: TetR family transcriptional regulator [Bacteroidota bacterium]
MNELLNQTSIKINDKVFLKNPESSNLGRNIISESIFLINELGFEKFTFRKLSNKIGSTESSIYRYFENKHKVLLYLTSWYWCWLEYQLVFKTVNTKDPQEKLKTAIELLTQTAKQDSNYSYINESVLHKVVIAESSKLYHTQEVDSDNKDGLFLVYKRLVHRVSVMVLELNPNYEYSHMLISTVIEGAHQQKHFALHLPKLTDTQDGEKGITHFFTQVVFSSIS